jgi:predicted methyltransferase
MPRHLRSLHYSLGTAVAIAMLTSAGGAVAASVPAGVTAAVSDASRPDADKQKDSGRKPAESVAFAGIKKGDKVADLLPGAGYYTRIFSKVVGDGGVVYAVQPPPRPNPDAPAGTTPPPPAVVALSQEPAYKNVKVVVARPTEYTLPEPVDVVWTSLNYHDIYRAPDNAVANFNKAAFNALKPGGTYIVIDHAAEPGSGARDTPTLHRIDPEVVKKQVMEAGFKLDSSGDFLKNKNDPHTSDVHDAKIRWQTDQFILKFTKPK